MLCAAGTPWFNSVATATLLCAICENLESWAGYRSPSRDPVQQLAKQRSEPGWAPLVSLLRTTCGAFRSHSAWNSKVPYTMGLPPLEIWSEVGVYCYNFVIVRRWMDGSESGILVSLGNDRCDLWRFCGSLIIKMISCEWLTQDHSQLWKVGPLDSRAADGVRGQTVT